MTENIWFILFTIVWFHWEVSGFEREVYRIQNEEIILFLCWLIRNIHLPWFLAQKLLKWSAAVCSGFCRLPEYRRKWICLWHSQRELETDWLFCGITNTARHEKSHHYTRLSWHNNGFACYIIDMKTAIHSANCYHFTFWSMSSYCFFDVHIYV